MISLQNQQIPDNVVAYKMDNLKVSNNILDQEIIFNIPTAKKLPIRFNPNSMNFEPNWLAKLKTQKKPQKQEEEILSKNKLIEVKKFEHVRINRARLYDWFVQVCAVFSQSWNTLWAAIAFLDKIIILKGDVTVDNIHLLGTTVLFMASKYHEQEEKRLRLKNIIGPIVHCKFTKQQIINCETEIFHWVCQDFQERTIHFPTMQDRINEQFKGLKEFQIREIMIELFYFWQEPNMVLELDTVFTEQTLVRKVGKKILRNQRLSGCKNIEKYFYNDYGCKNMKELHMSLRV